MPMGGVRWLSEEMDTWIRKTYAKSEEAGAKEGSGQVKEGRAPTRLSVLRGLSVCDVLRANTIAAKSEPPSQ